VHVDGSVNPVRDIETIETELILADLDAIQKQRMKVEKLAKAGDKGAKSKMALLDALEATLNDGRSARSFVQKRGSDFQEEDLLEATTNLLSAKPVLFVGNVPEEHLLHTPDPHGMLPVDLLAAFAQKHNSPLVTISGKVESEVAELAPEERKEFLASLGLAQSGLDRLTLAGYTLLNLLTFFTVGPKETHAWTAPIGTLAPQGAGKIHSDFERGFIRAEVIGYDDYVSSGGEVKAKELGKMRTEGKEYQLRDGDIVHFRFNV
jgi:GTP-binding protein YchF